MARNGVRCLFDSYCKQFNVFKPLYSTQFLFLRSRVNHQQFQYSGFSSVASFKVKNAIVLGIPCRHQSTASTLESQPAHDKGCPICSRNLTFTYKDVLLLSQFLSPEGNILNRRVTGVCRKQQRKLEKAIEISRRLGLIPRKPPALLLKGQS